MNIQRVRSLEYEGTHYTKHIHNKREERHHTTKTKRKSSKGSTSSCPKQDNHKLLDLLQLEAP